MSRFAGRSLLVISALMLVAGLVGIPAGLAQDECDASVDVDESLNNVSGDVRHLQFEARVHVDEDCAQVLYDVVVEELMPNGQTKNVRIPRTVKLNDGSLVEMVEHAMPADFDMLSYDGRIVECKPCDLSR